MLDLGHSFQILEKVEVFGADALQVGWPYLSYLFYLYQALVNDLMIIIILLINLTGLNAEYEP